MNCLIKPSRSSNLFGWILFFNTQVFTVSLTISIFLLKGHLLREAPLEYPHKEVLVPTFLFLLSFLYILCNNCSLPPDMYPCWCIFLWLSISSRRLLFTALWGLKEYIIDKTCWIKISPIVSGEFQCSKHQNVPRVCISRSVSCRFSW